MDNGSEKDVIVVGAGPAGSATATELAQMGYDVLLLDRAPFPRDKTCGDAVSEDVIQFMQRLGMGDKIRQAEARGEFYPLDGIRIVSPKGYVLHRQFQYDSRDAVSYVAPRVYFDALIQKHAVESGAEFAVAEVKEPVIEDGRVRGVVARVGSDLRTFRSRVVVGADGVTSVIMRHLRPEPEQHHDSHRAVALRAYIEDLEIIPHEVEFYLYKPILPGYAWVFPTSDAEANIGLGMRLDIFRRLNRNLKAMLSEFLKMPALQKRLKRGGIVRNIATWQLNFGSQKRLRHAFDGALLVGDAAGFINPLTGGGIHNALISARLAAQTIDEALSQGDTSLETLRVYEQRCNDEMGPSMRRSYVLQRSLDLAPSLTDWLFKGNRSGGLAGVFIDKL